MKIWIDGEDCTTALGPELARTAATLAGRPRAPEFLPPEISALVLRAAPDEAAYLSELVRILWHRAGIEARPVPVPHRNRPLARLLARVKGRLWSFLRYPFDRMAFHQNMINTQLTATLEFLRTAHDAELAELRARIVELERAARRDGAPGDRP